MSRRVRMTLLYEDKQHEAFALRFPEKMGWSKRQIQRVKAPGGRGAAEQFIRRQLATELQALRRRRGNVLLVVLIDGDRFGIKRRLAQLDEACDEKQIPHKQENEPVFIFVPTWNIETWLAYLDDETVTVSEDKPDYPRLQRERDCQRHVDRLVDMCGTGQLRVPAPSSLTAACVQYQRFLDQTPTK